MKQAYLDKLKNPKWQKKRLEIMNRDNFKCRCCGDTETNLNVHHIYYNSLNKNPWDYSDNLLITICDKCHKKEHEIDINSLALWYLKMLMSLTNCCAIHYLELSNTICDESINDKESLLEQYKINLLKIISKS
jgi:hypothetical protein